MSTMKLKDSEVQAVKRLLLDGWTVLRGGWPDFFCYRVEGGVKEYRAVEVKYGSRVAAHQREMHQALRDAGIPVDVMFIDGGEVVKIRIPCEIMAALRCHAAARTLTLQQLIPLALQEWLSENN